MVEKCSSCGSKRLKFLFYARTFNDPPEPYDGVYYGEPYPYHKVLQCLKCKEVIVE